MDLVLAQAYGSISHPPLEFAPIAPELILAGTAILVMLLDALWVRFNRRLLAAVSLAGVLAAGGYSATLWWWSGSPTVMGGMVATDRFSIFFQWVLLGVAAISIVLSDRYLDRARELRPEYYPLLLFCTLGMLLFAAAADLILVFIALEVMSLSLYLLTGFSFRRLASAEAGMKYFLLGAFSSAFFLYGVALAYGATGTTNLVGISNILVNNLGSRPLALVAIGLLGVGFAFKVSVMPFHMWTPDAYQGAPTSVSAFMAAGTKVAAFAAFLRVFNVAFPFMVNDWRPFIAVLAIISMVAGSVLAIAQTDIKRMLAYSSIAHAGFILVGFAAGTPAGIRAAMFYLTSYAAMIVGSFGVVLLVSSRGERHLSLASYRGLAKRSPILAAIMAVFLLALAGIPPTTGFISKVAVFSAAIGVGYWWLVLVGVLASVVAAFFYLRVIVLMYMQEPEIDWQIERAPVAGAAVAVPAVFSIVLGIFPGILFGALSAAALVRY